MVQPRLLAILSEHLYYDEIAIPFTRMQNECKQLIALLAEFNIDLQDRFNCSVFTIDQANDLVGPASFNQNNTTKSHIKVKLVHFREELVKQSKFYKILKPTVF